MAGASDFSANAKTFLVDLASDSGLDPGVIAAWMLAEEPVGGPTNPGTSNQNWLNIGYFDSGPGAITFSNVFATPVSAAQYTTKFLQGTWGGASSGIRAILNTARQSPQSQISAIQSSGWATSGYPDLPGLYAGIDSSFKSQLGAAIVKGGVAGLGGSGTVVNGSPGSTYRFQVGSSDNPDEDNWTAVNRLASEVNWYLFSDAETVYFVDGADLIAQDPGANAHIDRVKNADRISHLSGTLDNTAYQFVAHHRRKGNVQHKTRLAQVTSPTEVTLELFAGIDEFRAGDLIVLSSCGTPLDGRWVIGTVRRSVFNPISELTLVPPITPLSETQAAGTTGTRNAAAPGTAAAGNISAAAGSLRAKIVEVAKQASDLTSQGHFQYGQVRPYPSTLFGSGTCVTDCSGFVTLCYKLAGAPDPNGLGFDGQGFTGTLESRGAPTTSPQPGDLAFWSSPDHVGLCIGNGRMIQFGSNPGPIESIISSENSYHAAFLGYRSYL